MKLRELLLEERLNSKDKREIYKILQDNNKKNKTFILNSFKKNYDDSEREVDIFYMKNMIQFSYNSDHFEFTNTLIDICDEFQFKFKTDIEENINTTTFTIMVK